MRDEVLHQHLNETVQVARYLQQHLPLVREVATMMIGALRTGKRLLLVGNGGSALEAQHFAAELVGHYRTDREPLAAIALTADGGVLTAIANDYDYNHIFARQVKALGSAGDVLVAFSTSGNSANVLAALDTGRQIGMTSVGLAGNDGGTMHGRCDYPLFLPFKDTARIQEGHLMLVHLLSEHIDEAFAEG